METLISGNQATKDNNDVWGTITIASDRGENSKIWHFDWDPSGQRLAVSMADGGLVIWKLPPIRAHLAQLGHAIAGIIPLPEKHANCWLSCPRPGATSSTAGPRRRTGWALTSMLPAG
jgi:YD repeat-containing protein